MISTTIIIENDNSSKPLNIDDFILASDRAKREIPKRQASFGFFDSKRKLIESRFDQILIDTNNKLNKVKLQDIVAIIAETNFSFVLLDKHKKLLSNRSLKFYEETLIDHRFIDLI